jgi:gluconokinase
MSTAASPRASEPRLAVVVMGVSGCGKSSVAAALAHALRLDCVDGDDLHPAASIAKMSRGEPLGDDDRSPWLTRIGMRLADRHASPRGVVLACSALRRAYRERIRAAAPGVRFVFLDGAMPLIQARMVQRQGHFMPPGLLQSQFAALERPEADEIDVVAVAIDKPVDEVVAHAVHAVRREHRNNMEHPA